MAHQFTYALINNLRLRQCKSVVAISDIRTCVTQLSAFHMGSWMHMIAIGTLTTIKSGSDDILLVERRRLCLIESQINWGGTFMIKDYQNDNYNNKITEKWLEIIEFEKGVEETETVRASVIYEPSESLSLSVLPAKRTCCGELYRPPRHT